MQLYGQKEVDIFVSEKLIPNGYEIKVLEDCLVDGYVCIPPDGNHYYFVFLPRFLNAWSSALEMHKYRSWETVPPKMKGIIDIYEREYEDLYNGH